MIAHETLHSNHSLRKVLAQVVILHQLLDLNIFLHLLDLLLLLSEVILNVFRFFLDPVNILTVLVVFVVNQFRHRLKRFFGIIIQFLKLFADLLA